MSLRNGEFPDGWLTRFRQGVTGGIVLLLLMILLTAVPTLLAWLAPGADSTSAGSALRASAILALSFNHGGLVLNGVTVTLVPLLGTLVLGLLIALRADRLESHGSFAGLVLGYTGATAFAAAAWPLGTTSAPVGRSAVAAFVCVVLVGGAARLLPGVWSRMPDRARRAAVAAGGAVCVYLAVGALLATVALGAHFQQAVDLQSRVAGGAAGLPLALIGIGAVPNATMAAVGVLTGPGFDLGTTSHVSAFAARRGTLPSFPLLAGVPVRPLGTTAGIALIGAIALLAGLVASRFLRGETLRRRLGDAALAGVLAGAALAVLSVLAAGRMGEGALSQVGPIGWKVGLCATGLITSGTCAVAELSRLLARRRVPVTVSVELAPRADPDDGPLRHPVRRPFVSRRPDDEPADGRSGKPAAQTPGSVLEDDPAVGSPDPGGLRRTG